MNKTLLGVFVAVNLILAVGASLFVASRVETPKLGSYTNGGVTNGNALLNDVVLGSLGFSSTQTTSTTLTPAQFCATTNQLWLNTTAVATETLPSATSSYLACTGGFGNYGAWNGSMITNDSTNTINVVAGTGMTFKCETQGVGTSTVVGGCTPSQISLPASTTAVVTGFWDQASSSMNIMWGNMFK